MTRNQGYCYRLQLDQEVEGYTALAYLAKRFSHSTIEQWERRIRGGQVLIEGEPAEIEQPLKAGDMLVWNRPGWIEENTPRSFECLYLDRYLIVVCKPSGLPTLPGAGFLQNTLLNLVRTEFPEARPLHRLGRATSGIVLFARDRATAGRLSRDWARVKKQYCGLSCGLAKRDSYDIRTSIGPVTHPRLGKVHAAADDGKPARSVARVLERRTDTTLFAVDLHSGRPHQIRIHLASIGHPLLGDPVYQSGGQLCGNPGLPGDPGYLLHASELEFEHPSTGRWLNLRAEPPKQLWQSSDSSQAQSPTWSQH